MLRDIYHNEFNATRDEICSLKRSSAKPSVDPNFLCKPRFIVSDQKFHSKLDSKRLWFILTCITKAIKKRSRNLPSNFCYIWNVLLPPYFVMPPNRNVLWMRKLSYLSQAIKCQRPLASTKASSLANSLCRRRKRNAKFTIMNQWRRQKKMPRRNTRAAWEMCVKN